ncbi:MAG: hypothetical protein HY236_15050 [Acidobacteria bacterium]|nr:hypothetical protein [Acidobacteriota bacterium]
MKLFVLSLAVLFVAGPLVAAEDMETAFQSLKETVESKKDAAEIKKQAAETCALAREMIAGATSESDMDKARVKRAREIELYTEYALYATAVSAPHATAIDLLSTLEQQNPKSKYLDEGYLRYFQALSQTGAASKIPAIAEKALPNFPNNEDLLLVLADTAINRKQYDRALGYAKRVVAAVDKHKKPETMAAADWEKKRGTVLGHGHWIAGVVYYDKSQFYQADKELRAALPFIKGNDAMLGPALFDLGVANFQLGKMMMKKAQVLEAAKFSEQAAAVKGYSQAQMAAHNALEMKTEAGRMGAR